MPPPLQFEISRETPLFLLWKSLILSCHMSFPRFVLWFILAAPLGWSQQPGPIAVPELHPDSVGNGVSAFKGLPPDLTLTSKDPGGRKGQLWIRNVGTGLLIAGQVDGPSPEFARNPNDVLSKDHIEVWLAGSADVSMPPPGWGNQFGEQLLPQGANSCPDWVKETSPDAPNKAELEQACRAWAAQQQQYRSVFTKLFMRQWLLAPNLSVEAYATPAYDVITTKYAGGQKAYSARIPRLLKPSGKVQMAYTTRPGVSGYSFQIQIPYSAFPPVNTLELENLWLMVDVFNAAPTGKKMGAFSSSSPLRAYGKPETFNQLQLRPKRSFRMGPCSASLEGPDKYGDKHPGWFVPQHDQDSEFETDSFILVNEAEGYAYNPSGLSPVVRLTRHFWHRIGSNEWICGPGLAYQKEQNSKQYEQMTAEEGFDARRLQDGTLLVKSGPRVYYSEFGSGECGACPRYGLEIFALDKSLNLKQALSLGGVVRGDQDAADFSIAPDWSKVVQYQERPPEQNDPNAKSTWTAVTLCLKGMEYVDCGEKKNVQPPNPPLLKKLRDLD
jgi:hypothetical protein